jgi:hypothetical protein
MRTGIFDSRESVGTEQQHGLDCFEKLEPARISETVVSFFVERDREPAYPAAGTGILPVTRHNSANIVGNDSNRPLREAKRARPRCTKARMAPRA